MGTYSWRDFALYLQYGQINIQSSTFTKTKTDPGESNCFVTCKNHKQLKIVLLILLSDAHRKNLALLHILQVKKGGTVQNRSPFSVLVIKKCFLLHYKKILLYSPFLKAPESLRLRNTGCSYLCITYNMSGSHGCQTLIQLPADIHSYKEMNRQKPKRKHSPDTTFCHDFQGCQTFFQQINILLYFPSTYLTIKLVTATIAVKIKKHFNCSSNATSTLPTSQKQLHYNGISPVSFHQHGSKICFHSCPSCRSSCFGCQCHTSDNISNLYLCIQASEHAREKIRTP